MGKENLLDADESAGSVVGSVAVEQAAMLKLVAVAVARLLCNHFRDLARNLVGAGHERMASKV
jgi:hypothetical protein